MLRILALGDSYTIGEGVLPEDRWPVQLVQRLRERGIAADEPVIIAQTGWTTGELAEGIHKAAADEEIRDPFDLVTLLIGVNNQYRGRELDEYRAQFRDLLRVATDFAGKQADRVLVLSIPDWSVTPFAEGDERWSSIRAEIAGQIDAFNGVNRSESEIAGARYADITSISRQKGACPDWLVEDGLHPSGKMYAAWVETALPAVLAAVQ